ncbi:MAG TPA: hypothetical protein VEH84_02650 [Alphaproteobacteria bacterium]|nr:hypothetical protein [Alphaproteobacteria bacterium]
MIQKMAAVLILLPLCVACTTATTQPGYKTVEIGSTDIPIQMPVDVELTEIPWFEAERYQAHRNEKHILSIYYGTMPRVGIYFGRDSLERDERLPDVNGTTRRDLVIQLQDGPTFYLHAYYAQLDGETAAVADAMIDSIDIAGHYTSQ